MMLRSYFGVSDITQYLQPEHVRSYPLTECARRRRVHDWDYFRGAENALDRRLVVMVYPLYQQICLTGARRRCKACGLVEAEGRYAYTSFWIRP